MKTIYKYDVRVDDRFGIRMPAGAQVLSVQLQRNRPVMWAMIDTDNRTPDRTEDRVFHVRGTGRPIGPECGRFVGTFQLEGGALVLHLFEAA